MSAGGEHVEPRGSPGQSGEARPARGNRGGSLRPSLILAGVLAVWLGLGLLIACLVTYADPHRNQREEYTRAKIKTIDNALVGYKDQYGDYPPSLEKLAVSEHGEKPYLYSDYLQDEWGAPFRYDPQDRHPTTDRPKVFTVTPKGIVISNW
jgi:hypothetical protein